MIKIHLKPQKSEDSHRDRAEFALDLLGQGNYARVFRATEIRYKRVDSEGADPNEAESDILFERPSLSRSPRCQAFM
jgi:hypothetical protein